MQSFFTKIVGVSFDNSNGSSRQDLITSLEGLPCPLTLNREHGNPHDENAIAVMDSHGRQLGFLSRNIAEQMAPIMDSGLLVQAHAIQVTGGWPLNYGVNIQIHYY